MIITGVAWLLRSFTVEIWGCKMELKTPLYSSKGFTLIEVLVAMIVLMFGILGLFVLQSTAIANNSRAKNLTLASTWCATELERISELSYDDDLLDDTDRDGTNEDSNHDGVDDGGNSFGLNDVTDATADTIITSPAGDFTIFINVATDVPAPNLKTVYVHVQDNNNRLATPVVFKYYKYNIL